MSARWYSGIAATVFAIVAILQFLKDAVFIVVCDRTAGDEVTYPAIDLELKTGPDGVKGFYHKDGTPYPRVARD